MSKATKRVAEQVDNELLTDADLVNRIIDCEREQNLPELTVDEWNEIYLEVTQDMHRLLAL